MSAPQKALEQAKQLGVSTILTSGAKASALEGKALLVDLHAQAGEIEILAGAGINAQAIARLVQDTPLSSFHMSGKTVLHSGMRYRNPDVFMGLPGIPEDQIWQTDAEAIRAARTVLEQA